MKVAMHVRLLCPIVACLSVAIVASDSAQGATTLRWKFQPGKAIRYQMQQDVEMTMNAQGQDVKTKTSQTMDLTWRVATVHPDGSCEMRQTFDRIRFVMESPTGRVDYDSARQTQPDDPVLNMMNPLFEAMVGSEFSMKMDPLGRISDVRIPAKFRESLAGNPASRMTGMSEDSMKQMLQQAALVLPASPISRNDQWNSQTQVEMPFGLMKTANRMTYLGTESAGGRNLERIGVNSTLDMQAKPGSPFEINVDDQQISGTVQFDNAAGHVHGTAMKQKMVVKIDAGGQIIEQSMTQFLTMKLREGADTVR